MRLHNDLFFSSAVKNEKEAEILYHFEFNLFVTKVINDHVLVFFSRPTKNVGDDFVHTQRDP